MFTDKKGRKGEGDIIFLLPMNIKNATVHYENLERRHAIVILISCNSYSVILGVIVKIIIYHCLVVIYIYIYTVTVSYFIGK